MTRSNSTDESPSVDQQRSNYEQFSLHVAQGGVGYVNVVNQSYGSEARKDHTYSVRVNDGRAVSCSCPHHQHRNVRCKHIRSVEQNPLVLASANVTGGTQIATDGGTRVESSEPGNSDLGDEDHCRLCDRELPDSDDGRTAAGELCFLCDARCERNHPWTRSTNVHKDKSESSGIDEL